ncbi:MAG: hypothetical protein DRJ63_08585 [Thermoprotei archaeon]|nr:MAG: hypothetical protein DRJ63_08585 [Thermoprotei archaeon]
MRKYERIWTRLKLCREATVEAKPEAHLRIFRAVRKEKMQDLAFKLQCSMGGNRYRLAWESVGDTVLFKLVPDLQTLNL